jgi:hypothetical protein
VPFCPGSLIYPCVGESYANSAENAALRKVLFCTAAKTAFAACGAAASARFWFSQPRSLILRRMSKAPDLEELSRRYLELWQNQFAALAADPELAESMSRLFGLMGAAASGSTSNAPFTTTGAGASGKRAAAPGATAAGSASRGGGDDVAGLARRVAELEERLAALEGRMGKAGASARRKPRKRKS